MGHLMDTLPKLNSTEKSKELTMNRNIYFRVVVLVACLSAMVPAALSAQDAATSETAKLVAVLTSADASVFDKAKACQRLTIIGDESIVPELAGLLADEQLSAYARDALEAIPGEAPDVALRGALSQLQGDRLIGVLGSIGVRRDAEAIDAIAPLLASKDAATAAAAARALGHIGTPAAADILQKTLSKATAESGPTLGNACLICILQLTKQGEANKAVALCDAIAKTDLPKHIQMAAKFNAILALGEKGLPRLVEELGADDEARFRMALNAVRLLDVDASATLETQFNKLSPARQLLLLIALGDLGNKATLPTVVEAAKTGESEVRIEAIRTLAKLGDATVVPVLLDAAMQSDGRLADAARLTLAVLDSKEINTTIVDLLASDNIATRQMAIDVATRRKIAAAVPILLKQAESADTVTRTAAIKALGATARWEHLSDFIALAIKTQDSADSPVMQSALKSACVRMPQEECAEKLAAAMSGASTAAKVLLLEQIASVGGTTALETVVTAAKSKDDAMQDAATRLLGRWLTADAAPAMLDLAKTLPEGKYQIRALRGYIRIARQLRMTPNERMEVCKNTLAIAERSDDKALVLEVLKRYPTRQGLQLAESLLENPELEAAAQSTIQAIKKAIGDNGPKGSNGTPGPDENEFVHLFDGKTFDAWNGDMDFWSIEDGAIKGGTLKEKVARNQYLRTKKEYGDFELRLEFKLVGVDRTNGGIDIRAAQMPNSHEMIGYQADLGTGWWGCLYEHGRGRNILAGPEKDDRAKPVLAGQWNNYRIRCKGNRVQFWINGVQTVDYTEQEPDIPVKGIIALQVHGNIAMVAEYRNIRIKEL